MIDIGFYITFVASAIALFGVWQFNQRYDYTGARVTWMFSNILFTLCFAGRLAGFWDGAMGDWAMLVYFASMTVSNLWEMFHVR